MYVFLFIGINISFTVLLYTMKTWICVETKMLAVIDFEKF